MKLTMGLFVLMLIISSSLSLPAGNPNDDAEIINTSNISENSSQDDVDTNFKNFQGVVDTGVGDPYYSYTFNPFRFFDYFQDTLRQIRDGIEKKIWAQAELEADKDLKPNSTSVVEVIDGHKIEINETVYTNNNDDGHALFKIRVIQVRPLDFDDNLTNEGTNIDRNESNLKADNEFETTHVDEKQPATVDNEINKSVISSESFKLNNITSQPEFTKYSSTLTKQNSPVNDDIKKITIRDDLNRTNYDLLNETNFYTIIETTDENVNFQKADSQTIFNQNENIEESTTSYEITTNDGQNVRFTFTRESLESESSEEEAKNENLQKADCQTLFNQHENNEESTTSYHIATNSGQNIHTAYTRESFESESNEEEEEKNENWNKEWETLEDNSLSNDIEIHLPIEVDLSNDILINEFLADQSATHEPEAEIFSDVVINSKPNNSELDKVINLDESIVTEKYNFSTTNIK